MKKSCHETISLPNSDLIATVVRSKSRERTVSLGVDPSGKVIITAPASTPLETIVEIAHSKLDWINRHLKEKRQLAEYRFDKEFVSGESIQFLGKQYMLKITEGDEDAPASCSIHGKYLKVQVPKGLNPTIGSELVKEQLMNWYKQQAAEKIPERVAKYAAKHGFIYNSVLIKEQEKRWGSCDHLGNLRFNWKIIMAPISLVDYVVVHELCHLRVKNHTPEFWQLLERILFDYEARKSKLKELGNAYTL
jgi:predicted metal-dependent hydrolase